MLAPHVDIGGDVRCSFEIEFRSVALVHNQVTPPIVGNTMLSFNNFSNTLSSASTFDNRMEVS